MAERKPTSTSNFGVGRRENHDASAFYARFQAPEISKDDTVLPPAEVDAPDRRSDQAGRCPRHGRRAHRVGGPRRHVAALLRRQAVRGGPVRRRHPQLVPRVPRAARGRVRRVRPHARARRPHRGQRRQPRPQAVPQPLGRRHRHPPGPPAPAAAGRDHLAEGQGRQRQLRVGFVRQAHQPHLPRHHRAGRSSPARAASTVRRTPRRARSPGCRSRARSPRIASWTRRSTCGRSRRRAPGGSTTLRRSRSSCPSG